MGAKKKNKVLYRYVRRQAIHNDLFLLCRNPNKLEPSIPLQRVITKAINTSARFTQFVIIENLHTLGLKHKVIKDYIDKQCPEDGCACEAYTRLIEFIEDGLGVQQLVWEDLGEQLADLAAVAIRELRYHLSFSNLEKLVHVITITRERDTEEESRVKAYGTFNALCDKDTQQSLLNNMNVLLRSTSAQKSVRRGLSNLINRINKHIKNRRTI